MQKIFTKVITTKNGKKLIAEEYGLEAFCFEVTDEEYAAYLEKHKSN